MYKLDISGVIFPSLLRSVLSIMATEQPDFDCIASSDSRTLASSVLPITEPTKIKRSNVPPCCRLSCVGGNSSDISLTI